MEFGPNIDIEPFVDEFLVAPKSAVKKLTARIAAELTKVTVNAPNWESRHAAMMARKILWPDDRKLPLRNLRKIDQTLVDLFAAPEPSRALRRLRRLLNTYRDALNATGLSHLSLSSLPLPATLDPDVPHPLPTRFRVLGSILLSTLSCLVRLPFFLLPLVVHLPVYLFARYASSGALEEDKAQNKVAIGLVLALATYAAFFAVACALLWTSMAWGGAIVVALVGTVAFVAYHNRLVDANYRQFQRLLALWIVLFALWTPVARSEAEHFLHSVHPALSPHPGIRLRNSSDTPYDDGGEDDRRGLLASAAEDDDDEEEEEEQQEGRRGRAPLPSPALFSEQDRLLGGPSRASSHLERRRAGDETTIEMPPLGSGILPSESAPASRAPSPRRTAGRGHAQRVRELLRLRAETVLALREALRPLEGGDSLCDEEEEDDDDDDMEGEGRAPPRLEEVRIHGASTSGSSSGAEAPPSARRRSLSSPAPPPGFSNGLLTRLPAAAPPTELSERDRASAALAREVGVRMRELGWRGGGLGRAAGGRGR
ncbi:hypothetical protein JCM10449v2_007436 [Rhodotorula kratochvilovae]